ncbi:FecR family protein [Sphingomonas sp. ERG5]|uniref:FecR family protein n=1 Tax=Sphingomonas sp. ERG5 TaxID=1381597 RepID=UPI00054C48C1|nr:FecR domain-containing protein [Sphingomonas sp. ERG5]
MRDDFDPIDEVAAGWHLSLNDDNMDWTGFTEWLEADPRHRQAYDAIALLDERIDHARPALQPLLSLDDVQLPPHRRRVAGWSALAASLVAVVAIGVTSLSGISEGPAGSTRLVAYRATAGEERAVKLADGSTARLAPGSVLNVAASRDVPLALEGRATFDVVHDPAHPLVIRAGAYEIRDVGTRFEVMSDAGMLRVAVSEGQVSVRLRGAVGAAEVMAGHVLTVSGVNATGDLRRLSPASGTALPGGPMVYDEVPLGLVVADISRYAGQRIEIDPALAGRRFSGVIASGKRDAMIATLEQLTGLHARKNGNAIRLGIGAAR